MKKQLIKLGNTNPELRTHINAILNHNQTKVAHSTFNRELQKLQDVLNKQRQEVLEDWAETARGTAFNILRSLQDIAREGGWEVKGPKSCKLWIRPSILELNVVFNKVDVDGESAEVFADVLIDQLGQPYEVRKISNDLVQLNVFL